MSDIYIIPQVQIQSDALQVFLDYRQQESEEKVWLRIQNGSYNLSINKTSLYDDENRISLLQDNKISTIFKFYKDNEFKFNLVFPKKYHLFQNKNVENLTSVSACSDKIMLGTDKGSIIKISNPVPINITSEVIKETAHFADITKIMNFPSNLVLLTFGLDMQIKIWDNSSTDSKIIKPIRILSGEHKSRITDCVMIGKGRNIVSSGLDGKAVMWEIGNGKPVWITQRISNLKDGCTSLAIFERKLNDNEKALNSDNFFDCLGKVIVCGHISGVLSFWDCNTRLSFGEFITNDDGHSIGKIACLDSNNIIIGLNNGIVKCFKYNLNERKSELNWEIKVEVPEYDEEIDIKNIKIFDKKYVLVLSSKYLVKINILDGHIIDIFTGYDETITDFTINNNELIAVGKKGFLTSFHL
jgi:WD40 repeat protein